MSVGDFVVGASAMATVLGLQRVALQQSKSASMRGTNLSSAAPHDVLNSPDQGLATSSPTSPPTLMPTLLPTQEFPTDVPTSEGDSQESTSRT